MKNRKKNKITKIIMLMLLLIILLVVAIKITQMIEIYNNRKTGASRAEYVQDTTYNDYFEKRVMPRNIKILKLYNGNIKLDNFYLKLNDLIEYLLEIKVENNIDEKYFQENKSELKKYFGNIDFEDFEIIAKNVKSKNIIEFEYAEILNNTNITLENGFVFEIKLNFSENKQIDFKVNLNDEAKSIEEQIIFTIIN